MTGSAGAWLAGVAAWAERSDLAIVSDDTAWSGRQLWQRAAGAAEWLDAVGIPAGEVVPALLPASPAALALLLGGAATGRPLAPLSSRSTSTEVAACVRALRAGVIVADASVATLAGSVAAETGCRVEVLGEPEASTRKLDPGAPADSVAFVLHTSGTTGHPKAIPHPQGRLARRSALQARLCSLGRGDRYVTGSPFHHIAGVGSQATALFAGASLVLLPRFSLESWQALADAGPTHALLVPTMLEILLDADALSLPGLRVLVYGGAPIHPHTLTRVLATAPGVDLVQLFGQTEGSPLTVLGPDDHRRAAADRPDLLTSVGRAAPGVELQFPEPDSEGVAEVWARADHLNGGDADGWLHTGDLGRLDPEGYLHLAGRQDDMIIRGGENIHPHEVEQVLRTHPALADAAVVGVPDRRYGEVVKAVVVPADAARPPTPDALAAHTRAVLAGHKVPTVWTFTDQLPRNPAGKVLRRALRCGGPAG